MHKCDCGPASLCTYPKCSEGIILNTSRKSLIYETHGLDTDKEVFFYEQDYYCLSNFSAFTLIRNGKRFDTSEAAYHYEKFPHNPFIQNLIHSAISAHEAFKTAEKYKRAQRENWNNIRVQIMFDILYQKTLQHNYVKRKLLSTGDRLLIENSWRDNFWGWGSDKQGKNMLGILWMQVREKLQMENTYE